jgi:hypothetical protein
MPPPTAAQTSFALALLEELHSMLTLDEAVEILTGKKLRSRLTTGLKSRPFKAKAYSEVP